MKKRHKVGHIYTAEKFTWENQVSPMPFTGYGKQVFHSHDS